MKKTVVFYKLSLLTVLFFLSCQVGFSQIHSIGFQAHYGNILKIYPTYPKTNRSLYYQLNIVTPADTSKIWQGLNNFPNTGITLGFIDMGNQSVLGNGYSLQYSHQKKYTLFPKLDYFFTAQLGGMYFDKPYNYIHNRENIAIGNHFGFWVNASLGISYAVASKWNLNLDFTFFHSSNAHTTLPNVGTNIPSIGIGVEYLFVEREKKKSIPNSQFDLSKKWYGVIRGGLGINEFGTSTSPTNGPKYFIYLASVYAERRYSPKASIQMGVDAYYNTGYRDYLASQEGLPLKDNFENASVLLLFVGHEYYYNRFGVVVQGGFNLHNPFLKFWTENKLEKESFMERVKKYVPGKFGVNCYLNNPYVKQGFNAFIGIYIKSNVGQADFLEVGSGIKF